MTDLFDLVDSLKREVNPLGGNAYPDAVDNDYVGSLQDGFWEAVLDGIISGYEEDDAEVTPDLPKDLQRLVVFYAGIRIVRNQLNQLQSMLRTKAGPVEYEVRQDWQVLRALFDDMVQRRATFIKNLSDSGTIGSVYIDGISTRDSSVYYGDTYWVE